MFSLGVTALEPVYVVDITIERHQIYMEPKVISIDSFDVIAGIPTTQTVYLDKPATYVFKTFNKEDELLAEYFYSQSFIARHTGEIFDIIDFTIALPYSPLVRYLEIFNQDELFLRYELPNFCIKDGICNTPENYYTCQTDCQTFADDGICIPAHEGHCDPDCIGIKDLDCACGDGICQKYESEESCAVDCISKKEALSTPEQISKEDKGKNYLRYTLYAVLILILIGIAYILFTKLRKNENI